MGKFVVGTRFFEADDSKAIDSIKRLLFFIQCALDAGAEKIFVAVNAAADVSKVLEQNWDDHVVVFPVMPWGKFVPALNGILSTARSHLASGENLLLSSVEVILTPEKVASLNLHLNGNTLVVGGALQGHNYRKPDNGEVCIKHATGREVPWNTLALWNSKFLWATGFPMLGDGSLVDPTSAGVEEVATIAMLQRIFPHTTAKLTSVGDNSWDVSHFDGERRAQHDRKMASKDDRPAKQLESIGLEGPTVFHL